MVVAISEKCQILRKFRYVKVLILAIFRRIPNANKKNQKVNRP